MRHLLRDSFPQNKPNQKASTERGAGSRDSAAGDDSNEFDFIAFANGV